MTGADDGTRRRHRAEVRPAGPRRRAAVAVAAAVVLVVGAGALLALEVGGEPGTVAAPAASPTPAAGPTPAATPTEPDPPVASAEALPGPADIVQAAPDVVPTSLRVPAIGLDEPLIGLGLRPDGTVDVPGDPDDAGWLDVGPVPGRTGPAVLVGHVDSADGPGVFARLRELVPGDEVSVGLDDGTTATFVVTRTEAYPKDAFPTASVYGPAPAPLLRLITCGGEFDRAAGSYRDNVVVHAVLAA